MRKFLILIAFATPALADSDYIAPVKDPLTQAECSACHMAYPPSLLPAESWHKIMTSLSDHFGEDASLPEADAAAIEAYLTGQTRPAAQMRADPETPPLRITELPWFKREHEGEVSRRALEKAGSMANCTACHRGAERGYFEDD